MNFINRLIYMFFIYFFVLFINLTFCMNLPDDFTLPCFFEKQKKVIDFDENVIININFNYDDKEIIKLNLTEKRQQTRFYNLLQVKKLTKEFLEFIMDDIYFFNREKHNLLDELNFSKALKKPKPRKATSIKDINFLIQKNKNKKNKKSKN